MSIVANYKLVHDVLKEGTSPVAITIRRWGDRHMSLSGGLFEGINVW